MLDCGIFRGMAVLFARLSTYSHQQSQDVPSAVVGDRI